MRQPAHPVPHQEGRREDDRDAEPSDRRRHEELQLGPAVGALVQREPHGRGRQDHAGQSEEGQGCEQERPRPPDDLVRPQQQQPGERDDPDQLEVALARVVAVGHADRREGVGATEQVDDLDDRERREQDVNRTRTTSASVVPARRAARGAGRTPTGAPGDSGDPVRKPAPRPGAPRRRPARTEHRRGLPQSPAALRRYQRRELRRARDAPPRRGRSGSGARRRGRAPRPHPRSRAAVRTRPPRARQSPRRAPLARTGRADGCRER